jgi:hypothetical protein
MMKKFLVKINAYGYRGETTVDAVDSVQGIEHAILDKIGKRSINFTPNGTSSRVCHLTYEEIVNGEQSHQGSLSDKKIA